MDLNALRNDLREFERTNNEYNKIINNVINFDAELAKDIFGSVAIFSRMLEKYLDLAEYKKINDSYNKIVEINRFLVKS